jgi:hypothetical protein
MGMNLKTQLLLLKTVTVRTGATHEAQHLQLKMWPLLIKGVTRKTKVHIDPEKKLVSYALDIDKKFKLDPITRRMIKEISGWTKFILWDETDVIFTAKNKVLHDTRN